METDLEQLFQQPWRRGEQLPGTLARTLDRALGVGAASGIAS
jgi:hypothetical protein